MSPYVNTFEGRLQAGRKGPRIPDWQTNLRYMKSLLHSRRLVFVKRLHPTHWGAILLFIPYFYIKNSFFDIKKSIFDMKNIFWYQKLFLDLKKMNFRNQKLISWYQKIEYLISENLCFFFIKNYFDIQKSIFLNQEIQD